MNSRHAVIFAGLAVTVASASRIEAAESGSPWSIAVYAGETFSSKGTLGSSRQVMITNPGALDPALGTSPATLALTRIDYDKAYNGSFAAGVEIGYSTSERLEFYGRFDYTARDGRSHQLGMLSSPALMAAQPLVADFQDSDTQSLLVGARYFWVTGSNWRPFIGAALGAGFTDRMKADLTVAQTAIRLQDVEFSRRTIGFSQSAELGVEYNPSAQIGLRLSARVDHLGRPQRKAHAEPNGLGFDFGDYPDSRTSFPVALSLVYRFE